MWCPLWRRLIVANLLVAAAWPAAVLAQDTAVGGGSAASRAQDPGDIIVTANKREERITDVPYAITAIGQQEILDRGAVTLKDLQYSVPGLNIQQLSPGAERIELRGINPGSGTGLPIVSIYVDEVGISIDQQQRDGDFPLVDLARIEVLRGPQGTLYGQGAEAGTIRFITRDPSLTDIGGYVQGNVYDQSHGGVGYRFEGAFGAPIVADALGLRIAGGYDRLAGWIDYPNAGTGVKNANVTQRVYIRPKLLIHPNNGPLTISLLYQFYRQKSRADDVSSITDIYTRVDPLLTPAVDRMHLLNGIVSYDFGPATLVSSSGYQNRLLRFTGASPYYGSLFGAGSYLDSRDHYRQFNQEVRLSSTTDGPFKYTVGGWYRRFLSDGGIALQSPVIGTLVLSQGDDPVDARSYAVFGEGTYSATSALDVTLGGRYYWDKRTSGSAVSPLREAKFHNFSPKLNIKYQVDVDASIYATISKGFRSGGFNSPAVPIGFFGPEKLWNYEAGAKGKLFNGKLFVDLALFYLDYRNRQAQGIVAVARGPGVVYTTQTTNVGKASGPGIEFSGNVKLGAGLQLDVTAAYNHVTADSSNADVLKGERFSLVPAFTGSVSLSQHVPISSALGGMWRIDYQHAASQQAITRLPNAAGVSTIAEDFEVEPQDLLNARIGVEHGAWGLYADVTNILAEKAHLFPNSPVALSNEAVSVRPRSYGLTLRWNFDK